MSTDISVRTVAYSAENRSWLLSDHGAEDTPSVTLDLSKFTGLPGDIPSGTPLGIVTATGLAAPYDSAASDGTEKVYGLLYSTVYGRDTSGKVGGAVLVHGFVSLGKLPVALDAAGQSDLSLIHFSA